MVLITGTFSSDYLDGTLANDFISGSAGNDTIDGYGGFDTLFGGVGADTFKIYDFDYNSSGSGYAVIADFTWQEGDKVDLNTYSGITYGTGDLVGSSATDTFIYSNNNLIAVVQDQSTFNGGFIPSYDVIV